MTAPAGFLAALELAAKHSAQAEDEFRRDWAERLKALERERAFAHRRLNFMRQVLSRFVPVAQQMFASLAPIIEEKAPPPDVLAALAQFETWYRETHPHPFWMLFENEMPQTPLVDF